MSSSRVQVKIENGLIEGHLCDNPYNSKYEYFSFQGIPYAKPPVGELRFKAPVPVEPWTGIKDATKDADQCYARDPMNRKQKIGSEDCLYVNVYTPKLPEVTGKNGLKPVMVFIHGGAFINGSNSKMIYGPDYLICEDIVLVTINYRYGLFGFLSLDDPSLEMPGNLGFKDMLLALKWVKKNIATFNGDPNNITIFGESAGAVSVHLLVLSKKTKGLFHKAIIQSGSALNSWALSMKTAPLLAEILGIDNDEKKLLDKLKSMTVEEIHDAQEKLPDLWDISVLRPVGYSIENPDQEDAFLIEDPLEIIKRGDYNHVPIITGYTSGEGMLPHVFVKTPIEKLTPNIEQNIPYNLGLKKGSSLSKKTAEKIKKFYFGDQDFHKADIEIHYRVYSDSFMIRGIYETAISHSTTSTQPVYLYEMTLETSINLFKNIGGFTCSGVCHADDLAYLFNCPVNGVIEPNSPEDIGIKRFCKLWTNFAKYGNPNPVKKDPLIPVEWKPFTANEKYFMDIGSELSCLKNPIDDRMKFWDEICSLKNPSHKL